MHNFAGHDKDDCRTNSKSCDTNIIAYNQGVVTSHKSVASYAILAT